MKQLPQASGRLQQLPLLVKNTGKAFSHLGQDFACKPAMVQTDAMILSTFGLVTARVIIAFGSAAKELDPDQRALRWREAIRTFIREYGGWVASYLVLKAVRNGVEKATNALVGLQSFPKEPIGLAKFRRDIVGQFKAFAQGNVLPRPVGSSLQALEYTPPVVFSDRSVFNTLLKKLSLTPFFHEVQPQRWVKVVHQALPITIGSMAAIGLSGFALEWFTLHYADNVAKLIADWTHKRQTRKNESQSIATHSLISPGPLPLSSKSAKQVVSPVVLTPQSPAWSNGVSGMGTPSAKSYPAGTFAAVPPLSQPSVPGRANPFAWAQA